MILWRYLVIVLLLLFYHKYRSATLYDKTTEKTFDNFRTWAHRHNFTEKPQKLNGKEVFQTYFVTSEDQNRTSVLTSNYRSTKHVSPTTNVVERANSQAKLIMTDSRDNLAPETLSMLMILKHNKSLWPTDTVIQEILDSGEFRYPEVEPDSEEDEDDDA